MLSNAVTPVQIFVVAPPLVCWGLERLVHTAAPRLDLVGSAATLDEALPLLERHLPDVVVLDLDDGYTAEAVMQLHDRTRVKIVVLTSSTDAGLLDRVIVMGARAVLRKRETPTVLLRAIERVNAGEFCVEQASTERIFMDMARRSARAPQDPAQARFGTLTMRERQTLAAVTSDAAAPAKVIAGRLCMSEHTLRNHLTSIYAKLGVASRLDLHAYANRHQLNNPAP